MFHIEMTKGFLRDLKKYRKRGGDPNRVRLILEQLRAGTPLPDSLRDHQLAGKMRECRELHVEHDWLFVYTKDGKRLRIICIWLVSHKKLQERERSV